MKQNLEKKLIMCAILFASFSFETSIFVSYMSRNLLYSQIGILLSVNAFVVFIFEYFTGILSDRYGHKFILVLSSAAFVTAEIIFVFSNNFMFFFIGLVIMGISIAAQSGADIALLHDNIVDFNLDMDKDKAELDFESALCRLNSLLNLASIVSVIIGSWISQYNIKYPFYLTIFCGGVSVLIYCIIPSYKNNLDMTQKTERIMKSTNRVLFKNRSMLALLITSFFLFPIFHVINNYSQVYMEDVNIPIQFFGIFYIVLSISMSIGSRVTEWIKNKIELNNLIMICGIIISFCLMLYYIKNIIVFLFVTSINGFIFGIFYTTNTLLISRNCDQGNRATAISTQHALTKIAQFIYMTFFAFVIEKKSVEFAFLLFGGATVVIIVVINLSMRLVNKERIVRNEI